MIRSSREADAFGRRGRPQGNAQLVHEEAFVQPCGDGNAALGRYFDAPAVALAWPEHVHVANLRRRRGRRLRGRLRGSRSVVVASCPGASKPPAASAESLTRDLNAERLFLASGDVEPDRQAGGRELAPPLPVARRDREIQVVI